MSFPAIPNTPMLRQQQELIQAQQQAQQQQHQQQNQLQPPNNQQSQLSSSPSHHASLPWTTGMPSPPRILVPPPALTNDVHAFARQYQQRMGSLNSAVALSGSNSGGSSGNNTGPFGGPNASSNNVGGISQGIHNSNSQNNNNLVLPAAMTVMPTSLQDWRYESRREAQHILPHLYLGPLSAAKNVEYLKREGITLLIAVRNSMTARARLLGGPQNEIDKDPELRGRVRFESVDVSGNPELIAAFPVASRMIDSHLYSNYDPSLPKRTDDGAYPIQPENPGKTMLYCESGNERSAAVAAAYIMQHLNVSAVQAIQIIQGRRFCVCFDDSMKYLLTSYEPIWRARRDVEGYDSFTSPVAPQQAQQQQQQNQNQQGDSGTGRKRGKRVVEEAYDDEVMGAPDEDGNGSWLIDAARFEKREGVAPFKDINSQESFMSIDRTD